MKTIKNHCTATLKLHMNFKSLCCHEDVQTVFSHLTLKASSLQQTGPSIDFASTLNYVVSIYSATFISLAGLLHNTVFLTTMTTIVCSSDFACLQLLSAQVNSSSGALTFDILNPKE
ncbi:hypothetical protein J3Q64DRAFT_1699394 [Phycomyces blakesleeanus]|uniref:Uncharacterized protein n=2 Tax=Phycomyces blakesleeanus TaxID=4837 RepID=A0A167P190_PHYB8|nr:hypothetical protein PHYBLDRAFT_68137 [Phycomyces blakesleeanus NRRL 1555(-)]OAD77054.1 hypothetical protein PHYBLDRAFT_68137 [Phycomyces blakesleeanus NRRL 1555(-)]|eukprot:XP_018295094.1 hypothetical protein PHYBLDRAFT_68137 [Phycomyces blakesleeanus NRRL 1555(-)]